MEREFNKEIWTVEKLLEESNKIEFPEFQREPTIWRLDKKQRLLDSMIRGFDISSIYLCKREKGKYDCIDGQQRINAIWSYIGINDNDPDNSFHIKMDNEVYDDEGVYDTVDQKRFENLEPKWQKKIQNYKLNIVFINEIKDDEELNLQFLRLQLGAPLRAGEKLNAMKGDMRNLIFGKNSGLIEFDYFTNTGIRKGRFGRQEVAAQILINAFSRSEEGEFHRSRYVDLQEFFKQKETLNAADKRIVEDVKKNLVKIAKYFKMDLAIINNKAIAVSVYLFICDIADKDIKIFIEFFKKFLKTKEWQLSMGLDMNRAYRELLNFQTSLTQAAGEKVAIEKRHDFWKDYFEYYMENKGLIKGDKEFKKETGNNPDEQREAINIE